MKDRVRAIVVLIAVFLIGCLLGISGSYFWFKKYSSAQNIIQREYGPPPPHGRQRLPEFLNMTPEQETRFGEIMQETRRKLDAVQMEQRPKIDAVVEEANQQISSILNEQQKKKFLDYLQDIKNWRSRDHGNRRFGPPPDSDRGPLPAPRGTHGSDDGPGARENHENRPPMGADPFH